MKRKLILIKHCLHIVIALLVSTWTFAQDGGEQATNDAKESTWKKEKEYLKYRKGEDYNGPEDWYGSEPSTIRDEEYGGSSYGPSSGGYPSGSGSRYGVRYSPQSIQRDRNKRYGGFDRGGGGGNVRFDPRVKRPEPPSYESPDIDAPDIDVPDIDAPDIDLNAPNAPTSFWKILLYVLLVAGLLVVLYFIIRNKKPTNKKVVVDVENEWNPEVITKTELELKLESAMERGDYRECVRIYFTFILKELIRKGWIKWKREKTNHHYVMEMSKHQSALGFMECVRIYDLVWYGEYNIDEDIFEMLRPTLENYYKSLDPQDD